MPYIKSLHIPKKVYHYTKRMNLDSILKDGKIKAIDGLECWFCLTLDDLINYLQLTAFNEGAKYVSSDFTIKSYPKFVPEDYIVLELKPRYSKDCWFYYENDIISYDYLKNLDQKKLAKLKIGYRGDLEFKGIKVHEMTVVLKLNKKLNK
ncbi:hypothetical protein [Hungatella hathewayi]|uniref:hypothetical protein n=1 Tax=Hungatella hathewayi TaxID=154046 RepID=UPI0035689EF3